MTTQWSQYEQYLVCGYLRVVILPTLAKDTSIPDVLSYLIGHFFANKNKKENIEPDGIRIKTSFGRKFIIPYDLNQSARGVAEYLEKQFGIPVAAQTLQVSAYTQTTLLFSGETNSGKQSMYGFNINKHNPIRLTLNASLIPKCFSWTNVFSHILTIEMQLMTSSIKTKLTFDYQQFCEKYKPGLPTVKQFKDEIFEQYHISQHQQMLFYNNNMAINDEHQPLEFYLKRCKDSSELVINLFYQIGDLCMALQIDYGKGRKFVVLNMNEPLYDALLDLRFILFKNGIIDNKLLLESDIEQDLNLIEIRINDIVLDSSKSCRYYQTLNILTPHKIIGIYRNYFIHLKMRVMCYFDPQPLEITIREQCTIQELKQVIINQCEGLRSYHVSTDDLRIFYVENHTKIKPGYIY
eukprot:105208_1